MAYLEFCDPALLLPVEQGVHHLRLAQGTRVSSLTDLADACGTKVVAAAARKVRLPHQQQAYRTLQLRGRGRHEVRGKPSGCVRPTGHR